MLHVLACKPRDVVRAQVFRRDNAQQEVLVEMDFTWAGNQKFQLQVYFQCSCNYSRGVFRWRTCQAPPPVHTPMRLAAPSEVIPGCWVCLVVLLKGGLLSRLQLSVALLFNSRREVVVCFLLATLCWEVCDSIFYLWANQNRVPNMLMLLGIKQH